MKAKKYFLLTVSVISTLVVLSPRLWASEDYEELSYEQLVDRLSKKRATVLSPRDTTFDSIRLHAGVGLLTSVANIHTSGADAKLQNGFDLSLGVDLFSPNWTSEFAIRNFGTTESGSESRSLREFAIKTFYRSGINQKIAWKIGGGFGSRSLRVTDVARNIYINETSPALIGFGGLESFLSRNLSIGVELGVRTALSAKSVDQGSVDGAVRLDTHF